MQISSIDSAVMSPNSGRREPVSAASDAARLVSNSAASAPAPPSTHPDSTAAGLHVSPAARAAFDRIAGAYLGKASDGRNALGHVARAIAMQGEVVAVYSEQFRVGFAFGDKVEFVSRAPDGSIGLARFIGSYDGDITYNFSVARNGEIPGSLGRIMQASNGAS